MAAIDWSDVAMCTRVNDPKTSAMIVVMQRSHQEKGNFEHLCLPAEYEGLGRVTSIGFFDPRTQPGELLWPDQFGPNEIAQLKINLGSYAAAGQLQQRPSPAGGGIFKRHWFRYFQPIGANLPPIVVPMQDGSLIFRSPRSRSLDASTSSFSRGTARSKISIRRTTSWDSCGREAARAFCWAIRFADGWTALPR
jgi:hypothetical protein